MSHTKLLTSSSFKPRMNLLSNNYSPEDFNKSSTKRLYESVFKIVKNHLFFRLTLSKAKFRNLINKRQMAPGLISLSKTRYF